MARDPREIVLTALDVAKSQGYDTTGQVSRALTTLANDINTPGSATVILRASLRRLTDSSTVQQWASGQWEARND